MSQKNSLKSCWVAYTIILVVLLAHFLPGSLVLRAKQSKLKKELAEIQMLNEEAKAKLFLYQQNVIRIEADIANLEKEKKAVAKDLDEAKRDLASLQASEPVAPDLENEPLVINLRAQIRELVEMFTLSQNTVRIQADEIKALNLKCVTLESMVLEWKGMYERDHALLQTSLSLVGSLERKVKNQKTEKRIAMIIGGLGFLYGVAK